MRTEDGVWIQEKKHFLKHGYFTYENEMHACLTYPFVMKLHLKEYPPISEIPTHSDNPTHQLIYSTAIN